MPRNLILTTSLVGCIAHALAFCPVRQHSHHETKLFIPAGRSIVTTQLNNDIYETRRSLLTKTISTTSTLLVPSLANAASVPVQRAVGSGEKRCREEGNCLETFELDGAVGWNWGGADRCDASDPNCGPDGRVREEALTGKPVPQLLGDLAITHVVELTLKVGSGSNAYTETINIGLYNFGGWNILLENSYQR